MYARVVYTYYLHTFPCSSKTTRFSYYLIYDLCQSTRTGVQIYCAQLQHTLHAIDIYFPYLLTHKPVKVHSADPDKSRSLAVNVVKGVGFFSAE